MVSKSLRVLVPVSTMALSVNSPAVEEREVPAVPELTFLPIEKLLPLKENSVSALALRCAVAVACIVSCLTIATCSGFL